MQEFAIIVAGGSGNRMKSDVPKQFLLLHDTPILIHTLRRFFEYSPNIQVVLVLPENQIATWEQLAQQYQVPTHLPIVVAGGVTRFQSVKNGLSAIQAPEGLVAIHDGVRPFVSPQLITKSFETAAQHGTAVVCVSSKDSVRVISENGNNQAIERSQVRLIQTPQTFRLSLLRKAFEQTESPNFTDDASVAETAGFPIYLIDGLYENIKITTPEDLIWATAFMSQKL